MADEHHPAEHLWRPARLMKRVCEISVRTNACLICVENINGGISVQDACDLRERIWKDFVIMIQHRDVGTRGQRKRSIGRSRDAAVLSPELNPDPLIASVVLPKNFQSFRGGRTVVMNT